MGSDQENGEREVGHVDRRGCDRPPQVHVDSCVGAIALRQDGHVLIMPLPSVDALQTNMNMELLTELEPSSPMYYKHGTPGGFLFAVFLSPRRPS